MQFALPIFEAAPTSASKLRAVLAELLDEYTQPHRKPWVIGYSGGKDSTVVLQLAIETMRAVETMRAGPLRPLEVVMNDTLVESPLLINHARSELDRVREFVEARGLPVTITITTPKPEESFWVCMIGRGYPAPHRHFRWCTDRLKIRATGDYLAAKAERESLILLLGVHVGESAIRDQSVERYRSDGRLSPHNTMANCLVYKPIVDFTTADVWDVLMQRPPPWGGTHRDLWTLYRNAAGGECPLVLDKGDAPSCGSSSARFGCWTCTVVEKDRSARASVDAGHEELEPLADFRDWLKAISRERSRRRFKNDGRQVPGPFTRATRREILERLTALEAEFGTPLISNDERGLIAEFWAKDAEKFPDDAAMPPEAEAQPVDATRQIDLWSFEYALAHLEAMS
jgi:DNA sulfur modification protein DndC